MEPTELIGVWLKSVGSLTTVIMTIGGAWWTFDKWKRRDEHFPRIELETSVNFVGLQNGSIVCELVAIVENKGLVPLKYKKFTFVLRGLDESDGLEAGGPEIRQQLSFSRKLVSGSFVPETWDYSFIYPGIRTEYNFVTAIPQGTSFVRMQADLVYLGDIESHHAAKVLPVPRSCT